MREADRVAAGDDDVIQDSDVYERQRCFETLRDQFIGLTGFSDPGWMIMGLMCP